jgi:Na+/H+ antiporter NhaD/arsenite permease-like protein
MPDPVGIIFSASGNIEYEITRNMFFYSFLGIFFLLQLTFFLFRTYVLNTRFNDIDKPDLAIWFRGMFLAVNIFFILLVTFIGLANNAIDYTYASIASLVYLGPFLLLIWLMLFPVFYFRPGQKSKI